jgi:hypothetical protein
MVQTRSTVSALQLTLSRRIGQPILDSWMNPVDTPRRFGETGDNLEMIFAHDCLVGLKVYAVQHA